MPNLTDIHAVLRLFREGNATYGIPTQEGDYRPVIKLHETTNPSEPDISPTTNAPGLKHSFEPPILGHWSPTRADSTPMQIWEGTVKTVDHKAGVMHVLLVAKMGEVPRHAADIELEWVADQDKDLVLPGAVFYLTLYKQTKRGSINNSQELRFRRRPSWSATQLKRVDEYASKLVAKMKALPLAE